MARLLLFNKPFGVLSQFTDRGSPTVRSTLSDFIEVKGVYPADEVSRGLIAGGLPSSTPVLVAENASLPDERIFRTRLNLLGLTTSTATGTGPALLLIGMAVARKEPNQARGQLTTST